MLSFDIKKVSGTIGDHAAGMMTRTGRPSVQSITPDVLRVASRVALTAVMSLAIALSFSHASTV
jgi:hypothetical protein